MAAAGPRPQTPAGPHAAGSRGGPRFTRQVRVMRHAWRHPAGGVVADVGVSRHAGPGLPGPRRNPHTREPEFDVRLLRERIGQFVNGGQVTLSVSTSRPNGCWRRWPGSARSAARSHDGRLRGSGPCGHHRNRLALLVFHWFQTAGRITLIRAYRHAFYKCLSKPGEQCNPDDLVVRATDSGKALLCLLMLNLFN